MSFALIDWDDGFTNDITITAIQFPRKETTQYKIGERVKARCPGFKGLYEGIIVDINDDRAKLKKMIHDRIKNRSDTKQLPQNTNIGASDVCHVNKGKKRAILSDSDDSDTDTGSKVDDSSKDNSVLVPEKEVKVKKKNNSLSEEAKKAKSEEVANKKKMMLEREKVTKNAAKDIFGEGAADNPSISGVQNRSEINQILDHINNQNQMIERFSKMVEQVEKKLDILLDCKDCMRRAYKNIPEKTPYKQKKKEVSHSTPKIAQNDRDVLEVSTVIGNESSIINTGGEFEALFDEKDLTIETSIETELTSNVCVNDVPTDELAFVGDARFGIKINKTSLDRCISSAKTPEKLVLNLVEFVLSPDEIQNCTVYGNIQHKKRPIDENKRFALKSQVFSCFYAHLKSEEKQKEWQRLTIIINDKIRGMRKGKYRKQQEQQQEQF